MAVVAFQDPGASNTQVIPTLGPYTYFDRAYVRQFGASASAKYLEGLAGEA